MSNLKAPAEKLGFKTIRVSDAGQEVGDTNNRDCLLIIKSMCYSGRQIDKSSQKGKASILSESED